MCVQATKIQDLKHTSFLVLYNHCHVKRATKHKIGLRLSKYKGLVSKETVVPRPWGSETHKNFGFITTELKADVDIESCR